MRLYCVRKLQGTERSRKCIKWLSKFPPNPRLELEANTSLIWNSSDLSYFKLRVNIWRMNYNTLYSLIFSCGCCPEEGSNTFPRNLGTCLRSVKYHIIFSQCLQNISSCTVRKELKLGESLIPYTPLFTTHIPSFHLYCSQYLWQSGRAIKPLAFFDGWKTSTGSVYVGCCCEASERG